MVFFVNILLINKSVKQNYKFRFYPIKFGYIFITRHFSKIFFKIGIYVWSYHSPNLLEIRYLINKITQIIIDKITNFNDIFTSICNLLSFIVKQWVRHYKIFAADSLSEDKITFVFSAFYLNCAVKNNLENGNSSSL